MVLGLGDTVGAANAESTVTVAGAEFTADPPPVGVN